jgi:tetratricopeptide (TPR) repeat protein
MPPNLLKLIKVFGFEGDRNTALKALNFCSNSRDMRAPYADMVLLWYSTIAVPLFGVSEAETQISNEDTKQILDKNLAKYPKSSLFLYMQGKYNRTILKDLTLSLASYQLAAQNSAHIREIQSISIYEMGWLYLMDLDYARAFEQFQVLHKTARWSRSFSTYICAILHGTMKDFGQANQFIKEASQILAANTRKNNVIEVFALKRVEYFKKNPIGSQALCELLVIELLYMWVCIVFCKEENLKKMISVCDQISDKNFVPLKCLLEGSINITMKNAEFGDQCFNECLARAETTKLPFAKFVQPCAYYELALYSTNEQQYDQAQKYLNKAQNFKDFELCDRVGTQIKSLQRRIKFYTDGPKLAALLKSRQELETEQTIKKESEVKNFYVQ